MKIYQKISVLLLAMILSIPVRSGYAQVSFHIRIAPPVAVIETPAPRPYDDGVWLRGYYDYDPGRTVYVWHPGRWEHPPHRGARWIEPRYSHRHGEYFFKRGRWR